MYKSNCKRGIVVKDPVNTWTHLITFLAGLLGLVFLIIFSQNKTSKLVTMMIYGVSVIILYGASTIYHWVKTTPEKERVLRKIDHISIFFLIAGTYTPVLYYGLEGMWKWTMLSAIWTLSLIGIMQKVFFIGVHRSVSTVFYILLGWMALIPLLKLVQSFPVGAIILLFLGGVAYTIGGIIYATKALNFLPNKFGFHEIFHMFVSLGSVLHFIMIWRFVLPM
ncbi:MAG: hemolysin III family channel protein [Peptococcaceae bacterium BRH_c4b]|nr:MAG: hemolysin III family channel protein [Peptococcaceae bacterium BRH_c4b]